MRPWAKAFISIYGEEIARRHGVVVPEHELLQQASAQQSELANYALDFAKNFSFFNKGLMSQMQSNPKDTTADCFVKTTETNLELVKLGDFSNYILGGFDTGTFF